MLRRGSILAVTVALAGLCGSHNVLAQGARPPESRLTLTSPDFKDGGPIPYKNSGNTKVNQFCAGDGANISPTFSWANAPEGTKSYALLMLDPEGRPPRGVSHWVAYGISASLTGFAEGEVSQPSDKYVGGQSLMRLSYYFGPCPAAGVTHHYMFTLIATDLEPTALQPGLTRDDLLKELDGHSKGTAVLIGTFTKP
jgi:Raf kinase inhibitor-like YbhB/YbcL family protein